jgi:hypothetical protein
MPEILLGEPVFSCTDLHALIRVFVPPDSALGKIYRSIGAAAGEEDDVLCIDLWAAWIARAERIEDEAFESSWRECQAAEETRRAQEAWAKGEGAKQ